MLLMMIHPDECKIHQPWKNNLELSVRAVLFYVHLPPAPHPPPPRCHFLAESPIDKTFRETITCIQKVYVWRGTMPRVNLEGRGWGKKVPSSTGWIVRLFFLDEDTTEYYISEALLLHVERFFCEEVRTLNQWGRGILYERPTSHIPTCFLLFWITTASNPFEVQCLY